MSGERAFQQLDPLGTLVGRPMTYLTAAGIPVYAGVMTWFNRFDINSPVLAVVALMLTVVTSAVLVYGTSPLRAPFSLRMHALVTGAAGLAYIASAASMWGTNAYVRDDWGTVVIGLTLLSLSQYRPPKEIASTGLSLALFAGVLTLAQGSTFVTPTPVITFAVVAMLPILALALSSAVFGRSLIHGLESWQRHASQAAVSYATSNTDWIARSVQQDRVTILNQEVVPFFAEVLQHDSITADDRERARRISDAIRLVMVAEADRTWLDTIIEQVAGHPSDDPERLAIAMSTDQRTAIRAAIIGVAGHPAFSAERFQLAIRGEGTTCVVSLSARLETTENVLRGQIAPFLAVIRIVFSEVKVEFAEATLALRFSYEQR